MEYLAYLAQARTVLNSYLLFQDAVDGALYNPGYFSELEAEMAQLEAAIKLASPENVKELESRLEMRKSDYEAMKQDPGCWAVYPPALKDYQENVAPYMDFGMSPCLEKATVTHGTARQGMLDLLARYMAGTISAPQLGEKLDEIMRKLELERR